MTMASNTPVGEMSTPDIKRELMALNDSSFVFTDRDELECALVCARRMEETKRRAGLEKRAESSASSSGGASVGSSLGGGSFGGLDESVKSVKSASAPASGEVLDVVKESYADAGGSSSDPVDESESDRVPDVASVSTTSTAGRRGSSSSPAGSSLSPVRHSSEEAAPTTDAETTSTAESLANVRIDEEPPKQELEDAFDEPAPEEEPAISRRLVEYFVMVSCVSIKPSTDDKSGKEAAKTLTKLTKERPPDPARDKMNSRTRGRFDVRRVHLSTPLASSTTSAGTVDSDYSGYATEEDEASMYQLNMENTLLEPQITARYPEKDHEDQPLNLRLPQFCHPEGTELITPTREYKMPRVHHFVLTDSMGGKLYGTALTVYEEFKADGKDEKEGGKGDKRPTYYAPRVLTLLSTYPYLTAFRTYLTQLYRLATTTNVMTIPIERYVQNICSEVPAPPPGAFEVELCIHPSLGSVGRVSFWAPPADQPIPYVSLPFKVLFECLDIGNILFAWYTLACERKVLLVSSQLSLLTVCSEILTSLLFPMRWSHLYIPVLPRSLSPMLDAPMPYLCGISRENFPYAVEDISDETVVVDLDRNVITLGPNTPDLPALPHNRRKKLEGTLKTNAGDLFWEARNLTKADVLRVRASGNEGTLSSMLDKAGAVWEEKVKTRDDAFSLAFAPDSVNLEIDEDANVDLDDGTLPKQSRWDAVQEAFLRFYVSVLQDYRRFLPEDASSMEERSTWRGKGGMSDLRFRTEEFVASAPGEFQPFLEELCITQQFDDFVTRKMHNAADAADIKFFDQSIDAKKNRSKLKLKKKDTPFLHSACAHRDLKRVKAVEPNGEGLPPKKDGKKGEEGVYMYRTWPLGFDEDKFGTPRPIPSIISAEFDRRTELRGMLRAKYGIVDDAPRSLGGRNRSPEVTAFILFFATFTSVIGKEMSSVEQKHRAGGNDEVGAFGGPLPGLASGTSTRQKLANIDDDMEVARTIAKAQIDLGYHTLSLMRARKLTPEPVAYKLLIQACGRTKVTHRASGLMEMLARDGLATNSEIYTSLIAAFSNDEGQPSSLALYRMGADDVSSMSGSAHGSTLLLEKQMTSSTPSEHSLDLISESSPAEASSLSMSSSGGSRKSRFRLSGSINKQVFKNAKARSKGKLAGARGLTKKQHLKVTSAVAKQIELGESLLESLYPGIEIDTENACPKCSTSLDEDGICAGWTPCASNEYQTKCPSCSNKFVPKFSVSTKDPSFEGSQGKGTPLYCDHLSPWVLLREIRSVITATGGIDSILDEKFRQRGISATLWWNCVITFRRYRLPYIFLLQGSYKNQLILPSPNLNESMTSMS